MTRTGPAEYRPVTLPSTDSTCAWGRVSLALIIALVIVASGCGHPGPAPVVNREPGSYPTGAPSGFYRVTTGDTLYSIAWKTGLDHQQLAYWNRIRPPYKIYPGQKLRLTPPPKPVKPKSSRRSTSPSIASKVEDKRTASPKTRTKPVTRAPKQKSNVPNRLYWRWPTSGRLVQAYSASDRTRQGIKIAGRYGQPIVAAEAGKVVYSGSGLIGYGKLIIVKHNKNYLSAYAHNRKILAREGDEVAKGERIAEMGRPDDGMPLLHFEIRRQGSPVNPIHLLPRRH